MKLRMSLTRRNFVGITSTMLATSLLPMRTLMAAESGPSIDDEVVLSPGGETLYLALGDRGLWKADLATSPSARVEEKVRSSA